MVMDGRVRDVVQGERGRVPGVRVQSTVSADVERGSRLILALSSGIDEIDALVGQSIDEVRRTVRTLPAALLDRGSGLFTVLSDLSVANMMAE